MKTILFTFFVSFLFLASCSSDEDTSKTNSELILGEWKFYGIKSNGDSTPFEQYAETPCGYWNTVTYTSNNTELYQILDGSCSPVGEPMPTPYSIEGNYLIIHASEDNDIRYHIDVLNSNELILSIPTEITFYKR